MYISRFLCSPSLKATTTAVRGFNQKTPLTFIRTVRSSTKSIPKTRAAQPKQSSWQLADNAGRVFLGAGCLAGVGSLCYYGLGLSNQVGAIDTARFWPTQTKKKIQSTFLYFTGSIGATGLAAYYGSQSATLMRLLSGNRIMVFAGSMIAMIGSGMVCRALPYEKGLNAKHLAWAVHSGTIGLVIAPMMLIGGPLVMRAAALTAGAVGSLSLTAACAPDGKFLTWGGPLSMGLGAVFVACLAGSFLPATSAAMPVIYTVSTYGGLVLFGGFVLYDTQKIIAYAHNSTNRGIAYDPINASMGIYMDTINIFIRILMILNNSKKR